MAGRLTSLLLNSVFSLYCNMLKIIAFISFIWLLVSCSPVVDSSNEFAEGGKYDIQKTLEYLDRIIKHDNDNTQALFQRARIEFQLSYTLKAKEDIEMALEEEPLNVDYLLLKAKIDYKLGQYKEAVKTVEYIQKQGLDFNTVENHLFISNLYLKFGNVNKSEYFLQKAISVAPDFLEVKYQRARYYAVMRDTVKAISYYKLLLLVDSTHEDGLLGISDVYLKKYEPDSALKWLANRRSSKNFYYDVLVARALDQKNLQDSASVWWEKALLQSPRLAEAHFRLAEYKYKKGDYPVAKSHLASVAENERKNFRTFDLLYAKTSTMLNDSATAAIYYHKVYLQDSTLLRRKKVHKADSSK
jgi:tetratricopeptide (TPR) repeat protein